MSKRIQSVNTDCEKTDEFVYIITDVGAGSPINGDIMGVYTTLEKAKEAYYVG